MRRWTVLLLAVALAVLVAPAALSAVQTPSETSSDAAAESDEASPPVEAAQIRLEVFCYTGDLDVSQSQAAADCEALSEFGRDWEQLLEVLDADGAVTETAFPQVLPTATAVDYEPDGAWRGSDPVLPDGWRVIECPFLGDQDDDVTNGVGQTLEAEPLPYIDRRHVVCYQRDGGGTPTEPTNRDIPVPTRVDTGGGGTADW